MNKILISFAVVALIQLLWCLVLWRYYDHFFQRNKFLSFAVVSNNAEFPEFSRNDYRKWSRARFTVCGTFLLPFRLCFLLFVIFGGACVIYLLSLIERLCARWEGARSFIKKCGRFTIRSGMKVVLFVMGVRVTRSTVELNPQNYPQLIVGGAENTAHVSISNHITWIDIFYLLSILPPGFLAKSSVKRVPCVSFIARYLNSLFVEREQRSDRSQTIQALKSRSEEMKRRPQEYLLHVFPEGTTTNGKYVLKFKPGAFLMKLPLKLFSLSYQSAFDPAMNLVSDLDNIIGILSQPVMHLHCEEVVGLISPQPGVELNEFITAVESVYFHEFGLNCTGRCFTDKKQFEKQIAELRAEPRPSAVTRS